MKKRFGIVLSAFVIVVAISCGDSADKKTPGNEVIIPPPNQNDAATNPSSADTLFSKDTSYLKRDSSGKK
jgi:hypothetical protein